MPEPRVAEPPVAEPPVAEAVETPVTVADPATLSRQDRYVDLCRRGERGGCWEFLAAPESATDPRAAEVRARQQELLEAECRPCVSGLEPDCDPLACRRLDESDARVTAWLDARCRPPSDAPLSPSSQGFACVAASGEASRPQADADRLSRRGARLLEAACRDGAYRACARMGARYWDGGGPSGEMNERLGDQRRTEAMSLGTAACAAGDQPACRWVELETVFRAPR